MEEVLKVRMLGKLVISYKGKSIVYSDQRSRKAWSVLAYLLVNRGRNIEGQEIIDICWSGDDLIDDPANALKSLFYRIRTMLDKLEPGLGKTLIVRNGGANACSGAVPIILDIQVFESLCRKGLEEEKADLKSLQEAIELYAGDMCPKLAGELWLIPVSTYYHNLYIQAVEKTIGLMKEASDYTNMAWLCKKALAIEPYRENLHQGLMTALIAVGDNEGAVKVYDSLSQQLFSNFGIMPSESVRALYRQASSTVNAHLLTMDALIDQLAENEDIGGAMVCQYDFFKVLYRLQARAMIRSGAVVHLLLFTIGSANNKELSKRSLDIAAENFLQIMRQSLRKGDVVTMCNDSQYVVMLPRANFEDSCMVADRLTTSFYRRYPHSPAIIIVKVQAIRPEP